MTSKEVDVINVYRSDGASKVDLLKNLKNMIEEGKSTIVCGDLNLCLLDERNKDFVLSMENMGFVEKVKRATHIKGGHIDHVFFHGSDPQLDLDVMLYSPYYPINDHDAICSTLRSLQ